MEPGEKPVIKGRVVDINLVYTTLQESGDAADGTRLQLPNSLFFQRALRRWHGDAAERTMAAPADAAPAEPTAP
jgi:small-conductance mechanosensitive channel